MIAVVAAGGRTYLRVSRFRKLAADDIFLVLAVVFMCISVIDVYVNRKLAYTQVNISRGLVVPQPDFLQRLGVFQVWNTVNAVLIWASLFSVKFSFITFFYKLTNRVRGMKVLWWTVLAILCVTAPICMFGCFYICSDFSDSRFRKRHPPSRTGKMKLTSYRDLLR